MARFLFATQPSTGHVQPLLQTVGQLVARGHEVVWYGGRKFQPKIEATGARFTAYQKAYDFDDADLDAAFPGRSRLAGLNQIRFDLVNIFMKQISPQHHDLSMILRTFPADVVIGDPGAFAAGTLNETGGPPYAIHNITALSIRSRDTAPFGLGILPSSTALGRLRNRALYWLVSNVLFRAVSDELGRQRVGLGLRPAKFVGVATSPYLLIQPTVAAFEYRLSDLPPQVHFVGALLPEPPAAFTPPPWWHELTQKRRPVALVTQGTIATNPHDLFAPTLAGLAGEDVLVIAAGVADLTALELEALPANARVEAFVPFKPLLPYVDVYVTNGGYGGVHFALANGVPIVIGGTTEDKPEIAGRVVYSGVGISLKTSTPSPEQVRGAVMEALRNPAYRRRAQQIQAKLAQHDAPRAAAELLERLAATGRPVLRAA
jgi:MGT family glycosyltransferase